MRNETPGGWWGVWGGGKQNTWPNGSNSNSCLLNIYLVFKPSIKQYPPVILVATRNLLFLIATKNYKIKFKQLRYSSSANMNTKACLPPVNPVVRCPWWSHGPRTEMSSRASTPPRIDGSTLWVTTYSCCESVSAVELINNSWSHDNQPRLGPSGYKRCRRTGCIRCSLQDIVWITLHSHGVSDNGADDGVCIGYTAVFLHTLGGEVKTPPPSSWETTPPNSVLFFLFLFIFLNISLCFAHVYHPPPYIVYTSPPPYFKS